MNPVCSWSAIGVELADVTQQLAPIVGSVAASNAVNNAAEKMPDRVSVSTANLKSGSLFEQTVTVC